MKGHVSGGGGGREGIGKESATDGGGFVAQKKCPATLDEVAQTHAPFPLLGRGREGGGGFERLGRGKFTGVFAHRVADQFPALLDHRADRLPGELIAGDRADVIEILVAEPRNPEEPAAERLATVVESDEGIEIGAAVPHARRAAHLPRL